MHQTGVAVIDHDNGLLETRPIDVPYVEYLMKYNELWARSYVQFIVLRSGSQLLRTDLDARRVGPQEMVYIPRFWEDEDFEPIARTIESLFRRLKWIA